MNTVLGILVFTLHGQILGAHTVNSFPDMDACRVGVHTYAEKLAAVGGIPDGATPNRLCLDLTDNIKETEKKPPESKT